MANRWNPLRHRQSTRSEDERQRELIQPHSSGQMENKASPTQSIVANATFSTPSTWRGEDHLRISIDFWGNGVLLTSFAVLGMSGNILSLIVLSKPQMRSAINCCLQALAIYDFSVLFTAVWMLGFPTFGKHWAAFKAYRRQLFPYVAPILYPICLMARTGSLWCTMLVTVERYIAVCYPLRARSLCTYKKAHLGNAAVTVFTICYNMPRFWESQDVYYVHPVTNETIHVSRPSEFRNNKLYIQIYYIWLYFLLIVLIPAATLTVLNFQVWRTIRRANCNRQVLTGIQKTERRLSYMLFCVVLVLFACNILGPVVNILEYFNEYRIRSLVQPVSNCLVVVNSSVNFLFYFTYCKKFRTILRRMCCFSANRTRETADSIKLELMSLRSKLSTKSTISA